MTALGAKEKAALEQEIAELRAARKKREAERELELERRRLEDEAADEKRVAALEEALLDAESKHGRLHGEIAVVNATYADGRVLGSVIVKRPAQPIWSRFQNTIGTAKGVEIDAAMAKLWGACLVWPDVATVERYIATLPYTQEKLATACARLAGIAAEEDTKK